MSFLYPVVMPKMSMTMETGELLVFHCKVGDVVKAGDVLFEVMTDKIDMEVESPADAVVKELLQAPGAVVPIGQPVMTLITETQVMAFDFDGEAAAGSIESIESSESLVVEAEIPVASESTVAQDPSTQIKAVPKVRSIAAQKGIDLSSITPTGPEETIMMADLGASAYAHTDRQIANRNLIASGLAKTREIPQASFERYVNRTIGESAQWHATLLSSWAHTLRSRPDLLSGSDIGVAMIIRSKHGSALPVFKNPDLMPIEELKGLVLQTTELAMTGKVPVHMLNGATTTIFDLTSFSMSSPTPLLFPTHITSLTVGSSEVSSSLKLALTIDLRTCDFYDGAQLLEQLVSKM